MSLASSTEIRRCEVPATEMGSACAATTTRSCATTSSSAWRRRLHDAGAGWEPIAPAPARRRAHPGHPAGLAEEPLLRRVRLRLGLGRCLAPHGPGLLPEAAHGDTLHAGHRAAPAARPGVWMRSALWKRPPHEQMPPLPSAGALLLARAVPATTTRRAWQRRACTPPPGAVPLVQPRLRDFDDFPRRLCQPQAQGPAPGAPPRGRAGPDS
jgi:hypothetical protein